MQLLGIVVDKSIFLFGCEFALSVSTNKWVIFFGDHNSPVLYLSWRMICRFNTLLLDLHGHNTSNDKINVSTNKTYEISSVGVGVLVGCECVCVFWWGVCVEIITMHFISWVHPSCHLQPVGFIYSVDQVLVTSNWHGFQMRLLHYNRLKQAGPTKERYNKLGTAVNRQNMAPNLKTSTWNAHQHRTYDNTTANIICCCNIYPGPVFAAYYYIHSESEWVC